jgi:hypothetical protein
VIEGVRRLRDALRRRLRDPGELREALVSIAVGYLTMEVVSLVAGPLPPLAFGLGGLAVAIVTLYLLVPVFRRGRWR